MTADEAIRFSTVITDKVQPESFSYDFGENATVEIQPDGAAVVYHASDDSEAVVETIVANVRAPWAFDADGNTVQTEYVADGSTLTQIVKHADVGIVYPVVADPTFDFPAVFQSRVRFNRAETATIADLGLLSLGGAVCGPVAWACIAAAGALAVNAGVANNSNPKACVQITVTTPPGLPHIFWVDIYRGGPCR